MGLLGRSKGGRDERLAARGDGFDVNPDPVIKVRIRRRRHGKFALMGDRHMRRTAPCRGPDRAKARAVVLTRRDDRHIGRQDRALQEPNRVLGRHATAQPFPFAFRRRLAEGGPIRAFLGRQGQVRQNLGPDAAAAVQQIRADPVQTRQAHALGQIAKGRNRGGHAVVCRVQTRAVEIIGQVEPLVPPALNPALQAPILSHHVDIAAHLVLADQRNATTAPRPFARTKGGAENLDPFNAEREDVERLVQHFRRPHPDQLPDRVQRDRIGFKPRRVGGGQQALKRHTAQHALGPVGGGHIHVFNGLQLGPMEHDARIDIVQRPVAVAFRAIGHRVGLGRGWQRGAQFHVGLNQNGAQFRPLGVTQTHADHGRIALALQFRRGLNRQNRFVQRQPARRTHLAHACDDQIGAQCRRRLGQNLHREGQRHDRQTLNIRVQLRNTAPEGMVLEERCALGVEPDLRGQADVIGRPVDRGQQREPRPRARRGHGRRRHGSRWRGGGVTGIGPEIGLHDVALGRNEPLHRVEIGRDDGLNAGRGRCLSRYGRGRGIGFRRDHLGLGRFRRALGQLGQLHRLNAHFQHLRTARALGFGAIHPRRGNGRQVEIDALDRQLGGEMVELIQTRAPRCINGQRQMRVTAQNVIDKGCQIVARPAFDENPRAIGVHLADGFGEPHPPRPLIGGQFADRIGRIGKGPRAQAGIHRCLGRGDLHVLQEGVQTVGEALERGAVIGALKRQSLGKTTQFTGDFQNPIPRLGRIGRDDLLVRAVVHRQIDVVTRR